MSTRLAKWYIVVGIVIEIASFPTWVPAWVTFLGVATYAVGLWVWYTRRKNGQRE